MRDGLSAFADTMMLLIAKLLPRIATQFTD